MYYNPILKMNRGIIDILGVIQPHKWAFIPYLPSFVYPVTSKLAFLIFIPIVAFLV